MKITHFRLRRYRAFDADATIALSDFTVLVGPNNLGKSTVLSALNTFFTSLHVKRYRVAPSRLERPDRYSPTTDYPKKYEGRSGRRWPTRMAATVSFSNTDRDAFRRETQLELPDSAEITVQFVADRSGIITPQRESPAFETKEELDLFLQWFSNNFRYVYIPATRSVGDFRRSLFSEIVEGAVQSTRHSRRRVSVLERFYSDTRAAVEQVEQNLVQHLRTFLPAVESINFVVEDLDLAKFVSVRDVVINDGANTSLELKGDGFKSLFALSVLQYVARQRYGTNLVFGIEEPESHLHSSAVYDVKSSLRDLSRNFQVLITTHSPILIQRDSIRDNIVIDRVPGNDFAATARSARTLSVIRQCLGIRPEENLTTAAVIVVVEGATEEICLPKLLSHLRPELADNISTGHIRVLGAGGATHIMATLRALARDATSCIVLLDSDEEGLRERDRIGASGLMDPRGVFVVPPRAGCIETEFEDVFSPELYFAEVAQACGIAAGPPEFRLAQRQSGSRDTRMAKWSNVMAALCAANGHDWEALADGAKSALGAAIARTVDQVPQREIAFVSSIGAEVLRYLREG